MLCFQALVIDVDDPAAMVRHLRALPEGEVVQKQQAVLAVQAQFAYLERGSMTAPSAADLIAQAMCERWRLQRGTKKDLLDPQPIPAAFLKPRSIVTEIPQFRGTNVTANPQEFSSAQTDNVSDLAPYDSLASSAQATARWENRHADIDDPARLVGEKARQRRKRRKNGWPYQ